MKIVASTLMILFLLSCQQDYITYYTYNGVTVTRIDKGNKSYFYYGKVDENNLPSANIVAIKKGYFGCYHGYIIFEQNKKVKLLREDGLMRSYGKGTNLIFEKDISRDYRWIDSISKFMKGDNIYEFFDGLKNSTEILVNKRNNTKVKAIFPK